MLYKPLYTGGLAHSAKQLDDLTRAMNNTFYKKICVMGGYAVGKSSLLRRFINNAFQANYTGTLGVHLYRRNFICPEGQFNLYFWDLSGINPIRNLEKSYLHGAAAGMIVIDVTRSDSIDDVDQLVALWRGLYREKPLVLVANKIDAISRRVIEQEAVEEIGRKISCPVVFASAKSGEGVDTAFNLIVGPLVGSELPCAEGTDNIY